MEKSFGTVLNCIDGRTQIPVINWMKENFNVNYVDLITEPGMDKVLSQGKRSEISRVKNKVRVSIEAHKSNVVAVVGHYDCAGNPVNVSKHYRDIEKSMETIEKWDFPVKVVGLWVDEFWNVHVVET